MASRTRKQSNLRIEMPKLDQPAETWWEGDSATSGNYFLISTLFSPESSHKNMPLQSQSPPSKPSSKCVGVLRLVTHGNPTSSELSRLPDNITQPKPNRISNSSRKRAIPPPLTLLESIDEKYASESEYCLNLGAETPCSTPPNLFETTEFVERWAAAGIAVPKLVRRTSWRASLAAAAKEQQRSRISSYNEAVDRDCGICFEYAVVPCRTLCCGKIFCTEHLQDWLHGPNAEGRCPNCENACSLEGGTLSLASPTLLPASSISSSISSSITPNPNLQAQAQAQKSKPNTKPYPALCNYTNSLISYLQSHPNDTGNKQNSRGKRQASQPGSRPPSTVRCTCLSCPSASQIYAEYKSSAKAPSSASSAASDITTSSSSSSTNDEPSSDKHGALVGSTTPFATSWGATGRLMSTVTFLMFLYKLLS